jgi:hypothetical protein
MLDRDLAQIYGVETRALVQAVMRNPERFPGGFYVPAQQGRTRKLEITNCDVQSGSEDGAAPASVRLHRARTTFYQYLLSGRLGQECKRNVHRKSSN